MEMVQEIQLLEEPGELAVVAMVTITHTKVALLAQRIKEEEEVLEEEIPMDGLDIMVVAEL
jgi:isoprenylcysteine carboxyl methyltransferase (ICMT) family protein YpbQ